MGEGRIANTGVATDSLTPREREVAQLLAGGLTSTAIAERLHLSRRTVDGTAARVYRRLGVRTREQLVAVIGMAVAGADPGPFPAPLSSFVGRETEVARLSRLTVSNRLVALVGPGGVGKTRLAIQVARALLPAFEGRCHFVELSGVADADLADEALLAALGLRPDGRLPPREIATNHLADVHALLVLDNCEHVIEMSARLAQHLLTACRQLHVLCTSREALRLSGEHVHLVAPLDVPSAQAPVNAEATWRHSALRLFVARAGEAGAPLAEGGADLAAAARICRRLDGLPLALELAAVRLRTMTPAVLLAELEDQKRFQILTRGVRTAELRQRTLRATVEWSHRLLNDVERRLFDRLSVFMGAFDLAAARAVGGLPSLDPPAVADALSGLVEKSLVTMIAGQGGAARYRLLDTLRAFGRERLQASGEHETVGRAHARHYADLLAGPALSMRSSALDELRERMDDVYAALTWSCAHEPALTSLICGSLVAAWGRQGPLDEGCRWIERIIDRLPADDGNRAVALANGCWLAQRHGSFDVAEEYAVKELRIARLAGNAAAIADGLTRQADLARHLGDPERALRCCDAAAALLREDDRLEQGLVLLIRGSSEGRLGRSEAGRSHIEEAVRLFTSIDEPGGVAIARGWLGELELDRRSPARAREELLAALRILREVPDDWMLANVLDLLARLAGMENEPLRALRLFGAAAGVRERVGAAQTPTLAASVEPALRAARRWVRSRADPAWRQGTRETPQAAVAYALREVDWPEPAPGHAIGRPGGLTAREAQVAPLIAAGLANKEIAARLGMSVRTAEYHTEQIRRKLGFTSRAQIAVWAAEHGLNR